MTIAIASAIVTGSITPTAKLIHLQLIERRHQNSMKYLSSRSTLPTIQLSSITAKSVATIANIMSGRHFGMSLE